MTECIHGFEAGLCDICFPRQATPPRTADTHPESRVRRVPASRPAGGPRAAGRPASVPAFGTRRLYHFTHVRNLESILIDGALRSPADGASPDVDVTAPLVRELRAHARVGSDRTVADFVPFVLSPDSTRWSELRSGGEQAHWSAAARLSDPRDYLLLQVEAKRVGDDVAVTDGDAASPLTTITVGDAARAVARAAREDESLAGVEVLVQRRVPLEAVTLIGVANEPMRARVRDLFAEAEVPAPRVVVHTAWFTP